MEFAMTTELTPGQRAYEQKRAVKAGMSLDKWLASKERQQQAAVKKPTVVKKPGLLSRLIDRAHRPIK
jgi:hypothetical protein